MFKVLSIFVIFMFCLVHTATGRENYRAEIMRYVVDPCYTELVNRTGLNQSISTKEAVEMMKILANDAIEDMITNTIPAVTGKSLKERKKIYSFGRQVCMNAGS